MIRALLLALTLTGCAEDMSYTDLNGTDQYWTTPDTPALSGGTNFTITAFIAPDAWADGFFIYCHDFDAGAAGAPVFYVQPSTQRLVLLINGVSGAPAAVSTAAVSGTDGVGLWVGVTRNGTTGNVLFYTGGGDRNAASFVQLGSTIVAGTGAISDADTTPIIGAILRAGSFTDYSNGKVYEVNIYGADSETNQVARFDARRRGTPGSILSRTGEVWTGQNGAVITGVTTYGPPSFAGKAAA